MGAEAAWERSLTVASAREKAAKLCKKSSWREVEGAAACLSSDTASSCTRLSNAQLSIDSSARSPGRSLMAAASVGMPAQRRDSRACSAVEGGASAPQPMAGLSDSDRTCRLARGCT